MGCLGLSWPVLAPFSDPTWPPKPVQNRSQTRSFCGSLFSSTFKTIFCRFLIALRFAGSSKARPLPMILKIFLICACSLLRSLLDRFLVDLGVENRSKIDPKSIEKLIRKVIHKLIDLGATLGQILDAKTGPRQGQEAAKMAKTAPRGPKTTPKGPQDGSKRAPRRL